jgi:peroxiredoxin
MGYAFTFGPGDEIGFGTCRFFVLNPVAASGTRPPRQNAILGNLRAATELILFAFVVGFGIAQFLAYRVYHEQNKLLLAKAVPLPPVPSNPGASAFKAASNPAFPSPAKSTELVSKPIAPPVKPNAANSPQVPPESDNLAAVASLLRLVPNSGQHVGEIASDFSLPDSSGNLINLSNYRGKFVFLNFWATWCGACRGEMASLESLYRELKGQSDFELVTVSVDQQGWNSISPFLKSNSYDIPVLSDSSNRVSSSYGISGIPATFIVDRRGRIVWDCAGGLDWSNDSLKSALKGLFRTSNGA